jgi:hypothetical protein
MTYAFLPVLDANGEQVVRPPKAGEWYLSDFGVTAARARDEHPVALPIYTRVAYSPDTSSVKRVADQALSMAASNTMLRKIAAHVPARIWIEAKEKAGYGTEIRAQIQDAKVDEAWLQFVAAGPDNTEKKETP